MDGLENQIIEIIESLYKCKFVGKIKVNIKSDFYQLILYLHNDDYVPSITLSIQCNSIEEFLEFVKKELKERHLISSDFAKIKLYPYEYKDERCSI